MLRKRIIILILFAGSLAAEASERKVENNVIISEHEKGLVERAENKIKIESAKP